MQGRQRKARQAGAVQRKASRGGAVKGKEGRGNPRQTGQRKAKEGWRKAREGSTAKRRVR